MQLPTVEIRKGGRVPHCQIVQIGKSRGKKKKTSNRFVKQEVISELRWIRCSGVFGRDSGRSQVEIGQNMSTPIKSRKITIEID